MEVEEEERTQHETASYHSLRTSLSLEDLRTALHHHTTGATSPCNTAVSFAGGPADRWRQFLDDTTTAVDLALVGRELDENRSDSDSAAVQRALEAVIASIRDENDEPSLSTARRHSFQLNDGDSFVLEVPTTALDQYDDPWAPPNTPVDAPVTVECTTTCSTMDSISPSVSRERVAAEVAEYLLIKGGAWHANVNDSIRVEVKTPPPSDTPSKSSLQEAQGRSRSRSPRRIESATCRWEEESGAQIRDCGR